MLAFWLWHPLGYCPHGVGYLGCRGYNFWSGIGSDFGEITLVATLISLLVLVYRHLNCHYGGTKLLPPEGCHRIGRFEHGHFKLCHLHHPHVPDDGRVTEHHILNLRREPYEAAADHDAASEGGRHD